MIEVNVEINRHNGTDNDVLLPKNSLTGTVDPSTTTKGFVGQTYVNTVTGDIFKCKSASVGNYVWVRLCPDEIGAELAGELGLPPTASVADGLGAIKTLLNSKAKIATGTYTGNISYPRDFNIGFQPDFVLVETSTGGNGPKGTYAVWATQDAPAGSWSNGAINTQYDRAEITSNGFSVIVGSSGTSNASYTKFNQMGNVYRYIALKNPV